MPVESTYIVLAKVPYTRLLSPTWKEGEARVPLVPARASIEPRIQVPTATGSAPKAQGECPHASMIPTFVFIAVVKRVPL